MSTKTVAIKIKTPSGNRYFYGFGKGKSVQSAWSLAGAKLFQIGSSSEAKLNEITEYLKAKKKRFEIVEVSETKQEGFSHEAGQALSKVSIGDLDFIRQYADSRSNEIKRYLQELDAHLELVDISDYEVFQDYEAFQKAASNLDNLAMVLSREVERVAGI